MAKYLDIIGTEYIINRFKLLIKNLLKIVTSKLDKVKVITELDIDSITSEVDESNLTNSLLYYYTKEEIDNEIKKNDRHTLYNIIEKNSKNI